MHRGKNTMRSMNAGRLARAALLAFVAGTLGTMVQAHHSRASFDENHLATLSGTIKEFRYTNPHSWILMMVPNGKGGEDLWELEGNNVNALVRQGWTSNTLLPGMKVKLLIAPRIDGAIGGSWKNLLEINGQRFSPPVGSKP